MILFKKYSSIQNFLYRFTILHLGKLHIRIHTITDKDQTTLLHNHPFHYISFILKGGYTETYLCNKSNLIKTLQHKRFSLIFRNSNIYHRIESIKSKTFTLFIAYGNYKWNAINLNTSNIDDGIYERKINGNILYCKKENGIWFIGNK